MSAVHDRLDLKPIVQPTVRYLRRPLTIFREYERENLRFDLIAGLTVGVIMLPQAIAFALIAELPPATGLYAAVVGSIIGALWGSSDQIHNGPTNANSILIFSVLTGAGLALDTPGYVVAAGMLAVMAGIFQLLLGLARLGMLVNFVSYSVIVGFSAGAGVLIAAKQLQPLLGLSLESNELPQLFWGVATHMGDIQPATAILGIGAIVFLVVLPLINRRLPAALMVMALASLAVWGLDLSEAGVDVIGELGAGLPPAADLPYLNLDIIRRLSTGALAVGAIGLVQTMAMARSMAVQTGQRVDSNQEFVGQGLANIASGVFSGFATAGSFSRSAVNLQAGARSPLAAVFSGVFVLIAMLVLGPLGVYLPRAALAGVLVVVGFSLVDVAEIRRILAGTRGDALIMLITLFGTLFLPIDFAVLLGILLSFVHYTLRTSMPRVHAVLPDLQFHHFAYRPEADNCPQLGIVDIEGDLYFGAVNHVEEEIRRYHHKHREQRYLLIRMQHVNHIDFSGVHMLENVVRYYRDLGGDVFLMRTSERVQKTLKSTGFIQFLGEKNMLHKDEAISYIFHHILDPAVCIYECPIRAFKECQNLPKQSVAETIPRLQEVPAEVLIEVAPRELWQQLNDSQRTPAIIDVREPREYHQGHIPGARLVPLNSILSDSVRFPNDRRLLLVCRSGRRSQRAAYALHKMGCMDVAVLKGGMQAWEAAHLLEAVDVPETTGDDGEGTENTR